MRTSRRVILDVIRLHRYSVYVYSAGIQLTTTVLNNNDGNNKTCKQKLLIRSLIRVSLTRVSV